MGNSLEFAYDMASANQHMRIDLLTADAPEFTTDAPYIDFNLFDGLLAQSQNDPPVWQNFMFDITPLIIPGSTFRLRFAAVNNLFVLNMGVDNVSLIAVPEPASTILVALAKSILVIRFGRQPLQGGSGPRNHLPKFANSRRKRPR